MKEVGRPGTRPIPNTPRTMDIGKVQQAAAEPRIRLTAHGRGQKATISGQVERGHLKDLYVIRRINNSRFKVEGRHAFVFILLRDAVTVVSLTCTYDRHFLQTYLQTMTACINACIDKRRPDRQTNNNSCLNIYAFIRGYIYMYIHVCVYIYNIQK